MDSTMTYQTPVPRPTATFDRAALLTKLGGDDAFVRSLLGIALRSSETLPDELRAACAQGDYATVARLVHKIKGTAGDLVAEGLRERALSAEIAARESHPDALALGLDVADGLEALLEELRRLTA